MQTKVINVNDLPLLNKQDCHINGDKKLINFIAYKIFKLQTPLRESIKKQDEKKMLETLKDMNT